jgi:hypothetical protein
MSLTDASGGCGDNNLDTICLTPVTYLAYLSELVVFVLLANFIISSL